MTPYPPSPASHHSIRHPWVGAFFAFKLALWLALLLALPGWALAQGAGKAVVTSERVRAELLAYAPQGVGVGKTVWVGLQLQHIPEWHTYWKNSGDSGLPTQLQWTLPPGVVAGDIAWPTPKKIPIGALANYGYEGTLLLPVPLTITADYKAPLLGGDLPIKLNANWLVCRLECIPEEGEFALRLPTQGSYGIHSAAFEAAFAAQPMPIAGEAKVVLSAKLIEISVAGLPAFAQGKTLAFFPETPEVIETGAPFTQAWQGGVWTAQIPLAAQRSNSPSVMPIVLALKNEGGKSGYAGAWLTQAKVQGNWPAVGAPGGVSSALAEALKTNNNAVSSQSLPANASGGTGAGLSLLAALLGALVGGLILNLMPCVFPVLAIKVLGFAQHGADRRAHRISGLAYTAGVVLSFLALGALMLALRAAGEQLGWGFQLQSPLVVAALAALFTVIGLNLMGLFEFGQFVPSSVATLQAKNPALDAGLSGVLAVAVASPCTAPFMGASLGLAVALPTVQALLVFAFLGLGMALPYLIASLVPAVARALPRPGAWMDTFRKFMAFPMFATVAWLVWVLGQQSGIDGAATLLVLLIVGAMLLWAATLAGRSRALIASVSIASLVFLTYAIGPNLTKPAEAGPVAAASGWQAWEPGRVDQLLATNQSVFVDFTAAWCVTCQYNKKTTLVNADVVSDLAAKKVVLLRADWTRRDPAITAALGQLGRNGVPVYVFYKNGQPPQVLSEILSVPEVRAAIAKL